MPFFTNRNNVFYEIFYNYSYLWRVIAHFAKIFFYAPIIYYEAETKFCVFVCKSICVHTHVQTKRSIASKCWTETLEKVFEKTSKRFFKNRSRFFKMSFKNIFFDFSANYSFISRFFASLRGTRGLRLLNLV